MGLYNTYTCSSGSPRMLHECATAWLLTAVPRCPQRLRSSSNWGAFCVFSLASFSAVWSATQALCALRSGHGDWNSYAEDPRSIFSLPGKQSPPLIKELRSTTMSLLQGRLLFFLFFQFLGFLFSFLFQPLPLPAVLYSFFSGLSFCTPSSSSNYTTFLSKNRCSTDPRFALYLLISPVTQHTQKMQFSS